LTVRSFILESLFEGPLLLQPLEKPKPRDREAACRCCASKKGGGHASRHATRTRFEPLELPVPLPLPEPPSVSGPELEPVLAGPDDEPEHAGRPVLTMSMAEEARQNERRSAQGTHLQNPFGVQVPPVGGAGQSPEALKVAAAADLSFAFKEVDAAYEKSTGVPVVFSFGATGLLEKQIVEGGPFDVFAAANVSFADDAVKAGACLGDTKAIYATGHLVMFTTRDAAVRPKTVRDLTDPHVQKIAIANPAHAPYGMAARQALQRAGVWEQVQSKMVFGENVQQTLQFAQSGNVDVAIVALSLAMVTPGDYAAVPTDLHDPIAQALVVCTHGKAGFDAGRRFVAFVQSEAGHSIMRKFGFLLPGEALPQASTP
jgi:molybdate transport system substrate-binding protein